MRFNPLADLLNSLANAARVNKRTVTFPIVSKMSIQVLEVMKSIGRITDYEISHPLGDRHPHYIIQLHQDLRNARILKPHRSIRVRNFNYLKSRLLPSYQIGHILLSTSQGVMDMEKAREVNIGGRVLALVI